MRIPRIQEELREAVRLPRRMHRAYLAEDYDGIGQYVLVSLARTSTSAAVKGRVASGDFGGGRVFPVGTPVVVVSQHGSLEVFLGNLGGGNRFATVGTDDTWKSLFFVDYNPGAVDVGPSGWQDPEYDDSAWTQVAETVLPFNWLTPWDLPHAVLICHYDTYVSSLGLPQCSWGTRSPIFYVSGPISKALLQIGCDDYAKVWVNGIHVGDTSSFAWVTFNVRALIDPYGPNVIAIQCNDAGLHGSWASNPNWINLELNVNGGIY